MKKFLFFNSGLIALGPAIAAAEITPPIANYTGVLEQSRMIYPHPADFASLRSEHLRLHDHPAVIIAKQARSSEPVLALHPALWR